MGSTYPSSLDNFAESSPANLGDSDTTGRTHSERHDDVEAAVEQIEETLGTLPQGSDSTVRDRVAAVESDAASALSAFNTHTHASTPPALSASGGALTGALELPDGSASAPSLTNTGDTNTGVFFPAADAVGISAGGTQRLQVTTSTVDSPNRLRLTGSEDSQLEIAVSGGKVWRLNATAGGNLYVYNQTDVKFPLIISPAGLIAGDGTSLGAWTSYTPTLGGTGWAIGNGTVEGYYCQVGKTVQFRFRVTFGTTSTYGAAASPTISLPATPSSDWDIFPVQAIDGSAALMVPVFARYVTSALALIKHDGTGLTATVPFTWASTDVLRGGGTYEAV